MIFTAPDAWTPAFCREVRSAIDRGDATPAEIFDGGFVVDRRVRDVLEVDIAEETLAAVEERIAAVRPQIASFFGLSLTQIEGPSFLRYRAGGFYRRHCDCAAADTAMGGRLVSFVFFLNSAAERHGAEGFAGGSLRLYSESGVRNDWDLNAEEPAIDIVPREGLLIAFPADMPHEALPVRSGMRDVVVGWYG